VIRHTPPGTTVLTSVRANGSPEITVRDDGPGIPDEALAHLFGRLYRGDDARTRGTGTGLAGLGLTIAAAIVDAHGGRISAANVQPSGLQVVIAFPQQTLR
jgi:signal transduction histidine kinase